MTPSETAIDTVKSLLTDATREADLALGVGEVVANTDLSEAEAEAAIDAIRQGTHAQAGETLVIHHGDPPLYQFEAASG